MKLLLLFFAAVIFSAPAPAQTRSKEPPPQGLNGRTMESCRADIQKHCESANLKQECLVAHWTHISSDCQDALAIPMRNGGEGG
jgi:hypothetical protein